MTSLKSGREQDPGVGLRHQLHEVIFESDTPAGKLFDVVLIVAIIVSVLAVVLETVDSVAASFGPQLRTIEWAFTILFSVEYVARLFAVKRPSLYTRSFFGVIDLAAVAPTYLALILPGARYVLVIRLLRVLRVFRVLKLGAYLSEADVLLRALAASRRKILVFLITVATLVVILGSLMYLIEGETGGFDNIPRSMYWAVVTLTTVGYGDIAPQTPLGQAIASLIMILGYGIIAVPTGIVTVELAEARKGVSGQACPDCGEGSHAPDARFCRLCGATL